MDRQTDGGTEGGRRGCLGLPALSHLCLPSTWGWHLDLTHKHKRYKHSFKTGGENHMVTFTGQTKTATGASGTSVLRAKGGLPLLVGRPWASGGLRRG